MDPVKWEPHLGVGKSDRGWWAPDRKKGSGSIRNSQHQSVQAWSGEGGEQFSLGEGRSFAERSFGKEGDQEKSPGTFLWTWIDLVLRKGPD